MSTVNVRRRRKSDARQTGRPFRFGSRKFCASKFGSRKFSIEWREVWMRWLRNRWELMCGEGRNPGNQNCAHFGSSQVTSGHHTATSWLRLTKRWAGEDSGVRHLEGWFPYLSVCRVSYSRNRRVVRRDWHQFLTHILLGHIITAHTILTCLSIPFIVGFSIFVICARMGTVQWSPFASTVDSSYRGFLILALWIHRTCF